MKKALIIISLITCLYISACSTASKNNNKRVDDLVEKFKSSEIKVDKQTQMLAPFIGASEGVALETTGVIQSVEFYKFDVDIPSQKAALEKYSREGGFEVMGTKYPVIINGTFMLLIKPKHPKWSSIEKVFLAF